MNGIGIILTIVAVLVSIEVYKDRKEISELLNEFRIIGRPILYTVFVVVFFLYVGVISCAAYTILRLIKMILS